uniref:Ig-like domain-containing protein n=1 Tax=Haplochromis burtoni TaxID=8153 RepID=A0A3Q2X3P7_HAPBU
MSFYSCYLTSVCVKRNWKLDPVISEMFNTTKQHVVSPPKPTVTLQPSWTQIYSGETVTVRCDIQGGEGAQWTYKWRPAKGNTPPTSNEYRISSAVESDSGGYSCRGTRTYLLTQWSDTITLTVSCKLQMFHPDYLFHQNQ